MEKRELPWEGLRARIGFMHEEEVPDVTEGCRERQVDIHGHDFVRLSMRRRIQWLQRNQDQSGKIYEKQNELNGVKHLNRKRM
jgi:hypothetical protein